MVTAEARENDKSSSRKSEWLTFLFVTMVVFPALTVAIVGGYGFVVWMLHLINGPPVAG